MRRRSPSYSPPRRRRSPSPRGRRGYNRGVDLPTSLLVRNIPRDCRTEDLRIPFERYGVIKDVYLPRDYYTGKAVEVKITPGEPVCKQKIPEVSGRP
jgi:FUS-interacting serine-arginine-rich protein 1